MTTTRTQRYALILTALGIALLVGVTLRLLGSDSSRVSASPDAGERTGERAGSTPVDISEVPSRSREARGVLAAGRPSADSAPATASAEEPGHLLVAVTTGSGDRVQAEVVVRDRRNEHIEREVARAATSTGGVATFELAPGDYLLAVDADSLDDGLQGPWFPSDEPPPEASEGLFATPMTIAAGETRELTLRVLLETVIYGHVVPPAGLPTAESTVQLQSWSAPTMPRTIYTGTDELGYYEARVYPGRWGAVVQNTPLEHSSGSRGTSPERAALLGDWTPESHPHHGHMKPRPAGIVVEEGARTRLDLVYPNTATIVRGRIVDQYDEPFEGLPVTAHVLPTGDESGADRYLTNLVLQATESDELGRFELRGFPPGEYQLRIAIDGYRPDARPGENLLGDHIPLQPFEVPNSARDVTLPTLVAQRSEPFQYLGTLDWQRGPGFESRPFRSLTVLATFHEGLRRETAKRWPLPVNGEGVFQWWCETPEGEVTVEIKAPDGKQKTIAVWPVPNERRIETLTLR